jgi:hypothetical protein
VDRAQILNNEVDAELKRRERKAYAHLKRRERDAYAHLESKK